MDDDFDIYDELDNYTEQPEDDFVEDANLFDGLFSEEVGYEYVQYVEFDGSLKTGISLEFTDESGYESIVYLDLAGLIVLAENIQECISNIQENDS